MALFKKNINLVSENNTGFGVNSENSGGRFVTIDGKPNVEKRGMSVFERYSWYHTMLSLPRWKFFLFIFLVYVLINLFFAVVYFTLGVEHLGGINKGTSFHNFIESFFFSAQTFTTVGYGRINRLLKQKQVNQEKLQKLLCCWLYNQPGLFFHTQQL